MVARPSASSWSPLYVTPARNKLLSFLFSPRTLSFFLPLLPLRCFRLRPTHRGLLNPAFPTLFTSICSLRPPAETAGRTRYRSFFPSFVGQTHARQLKQRLCSLTRVQRSRMQQKHTRSLGKNKTHNRWGDFVTVDRYVVCNALPVRLVRRCPGGRMAAAYC